MFNKLPKWEYIGCAIIYIAFLFAGFHNVCSIRNDALQKYPYGEFTPGWKLLGGYRDDWGYEWELFKNTFWENLHLLIIHSIFTELCRFLAPKRVYQCHLIIGLAFILALFDIKVVVALALQIFTFFLIGKFTKSVIYIWINVALWQFAIHYVKENGIGLPTHMYFKMVLILSWNMLKSVSFNVDKIKCENKEDLKKYNFLYFCSYCLYFPTLVHGPFMVYDRYKSFMIEPINVRDTIKERSINLVFHLARIIFWMFVLDFMSHYFFIFFLETNPEAVKSLNAWGLYGFGFLMGIFFTVQYTAYYGTGIVFARFENINAPNPPKCVARIHFYSDMWKYFDQGLYEFLFKYIYASVCSKGSSFSHKAFGSLATFAYIYIWHGQYTFVFIWTATNFVCLMLEKLFREFIQTDIYKNYTKKSLSDVNQYRLYSFLASQIYIPSALSNFYFFGGVETGNHFMLKTYTSIIVYLIVSLFSYTIVQCGEVVKEWEHTMQIDELNQHESKINESSKEKYS